MNFIQSIINNIIHYFNILMEKFSRPNKQEEKVIISCDASITKNPGGDAAVGFVIECPGSKTLKISKGTPSRTNNQAEYDAVYEALTTLFDLKNNLSYPVEVRSDSKLVIRQLNGEWQCNDKDLDRRRKIILELVNQLPVEIKFVWFPRNSTPALKLANNEAQNYLGVRNR